MYARNGDVALTDRDSRSRAKVVSYSLVAGGALLAGLMFTLSTVLESTFLVLVLLVAAGLVLAAAFLLSLRNSGRVRRLEDLLLERLEPEAEHAVGRVSVNDGPPRIGAIAVKGRVLVVLLEDSDQASEFDLQLAKIRS